MICGDGQRKKCLQNTCVACASMTPCQARLRLYEVLNILSKSVMCFDTNSIAYEYQKDQTQCIKWLVSWSMEV